LSILRNFRPGWRRPALLVAGLAVLAGAFVVTAAEKADVTDLTPQAISITAHPINFASSDPGKRDFGRLTYPGGVILTSRSDYFGGYSGIALDEKGEQFLAISDAASWLTGRFDYKDGKLVGVKDARIGAIPEKDGKALRNGHRDAESLVALKAGSLDGRYLIGFERRHRIDEYVFEKGGMRGPVGKRQLPEPLKGMKSNSGLEAIGVLRGGPYAGAMVAFAERKLTAGGNHIGALVKDGKAHPLFIAAAGDYSITDVQGMKDGGLVFLDRSFNPATRRLDIRLRMVKAADVKPGTVLPGETLLEAGQSLEIDNFEGLAVSQNAAGDTVLTIISDDNFNLVQRTLLMQFKLN
jgi:hypothetical protein